MSVCGQWLKLDVNRAPHRSAGMAKCHLQNMGGKIRMSAWQEHYAL